MKYKMKELSIEITYDCPMNCIHCSSRAGAKNDIMIPYEKIIEMIDKCKTHCGTECVSLSGGEPFQHPHFWDILKHIKNIGLKSIVYSCGIEKLEDTEGNYRYTQFTLERIFKLRELCDKLIISLHGSPDKHNKIMDIGDNAFTCAVNTIESVRHQRIDVEIHFVPTKINYKDIKFVFGLCFGLEVSKMSILRYVPQGRGLENENDGKRLNLTKEEFMELNKDMKDIKDLVKNNKSNFYKTQFRAGIPADFTFLIEYLEGNEKTEKFCACTGGKTKILVKADGLIQVCPAWKELDHLSAGNIYKEDIVDIWEHGYTYEEFRKFKKEDLTEPCKSCRFLESCLGGCTAQRILNHEPYNLDGMYIAPDPLCFLDLIEKEKKEMTPEQKIKLLKGILDPYDIERNRRLGKKLFKKI